MSCLCLSEAKGMWKTMKSAIVTGANGFIGRWLVKELSEHNYYVYAVVRKNHSYICKNQNVKIVECPMSEILSLREKLTITNIDKFFHLAWNASGGEGRANYDLQLKNVKESCDVAELAKQLQVKHFFGVGTLTENIVEDLLEDENISTNMIYAVSKKMTRYFLDIAFRQNATKFTWLQFSNVYGPYNQSGNLLSYALNAMMKKEVPEFSSGEQPYDFVYVKDLVRAIRLISDMDSGKQYYFIGSGTSLKLKEYLQKLPSIIGNNSQLEIGKRAEDGVKYEKSWFDCSDLIEEVGYTAEYSFEKGIKETIEWLKNKDN